ncbi:MAG: metal ABC transporter permease, partial [Lysobacter sp.]|nr:metal ABC transporter permease [Lysobacter sp.]
MQTPTEPQQQASDEVVATPDTVAGSAPVARAAGARADWQVLRSLSPFLKPFTGRILFALALVVAGKLANLAVPMVLKKLVDGLNVAPTLLVLPVALLLAYGASRVA